MTTKKNYLALLCAAALSAACGGDAVQNITGPLPPSAIKFFNFSVNGPGVNFYANDTKMTAISSATGTESTNGVNYGGVGSGGFYDAINPGDYTLAGKIAATTDKDLAISSLPATIADSKYYSYYLSGFYNTTTKTTDSFIVEDDLPAVDYNAAFVRFVNAISNSSPMTLYAKNTTTAVETAIGGDVAYKAGGAFVALPGGGIYDLATRTTGSSTNAIARTAVSFSPGRIYTIAARGDMTVTSSTATNRPFLDNTANR